MEAQQLNDVAAAIADGTPVDWESVESSASTPAEREIIAQLRLLATVGMVLRTGVPEGAAGRRGRASPPATRRSAEEAKHDRGWCRYPTSHWRHLTVSEVVGRGGFGTVYRAVDPKLDKVVALKLIPAGASLRSEAEVLGEGRRLARVRHPNVVTIHGADHEEGYFGLWMEFVRGRTLRQIVERRGPFGSDEALLIGVEVARALAAVHQAGLVHRDVKAQNVMREDGGRLVLMDFGAGEDLRGVAARPGTAGTPMYMAPEVLNGGRATPQSDIYSLGVLLFYLVTGTHPVSGNTWTEVRAAHLAGRRALLRDLRPDLPAGFVQCVEMLIAPVAGDRVQTAGAAEALLQQTLVSQPRAGALWAGMAAALTLALLAGAGVGTWRGWFGGSPPVRSVAVMPMANLSGDASRDYFVDGMTDQVIAELSRLGAVRVTDRTSVMGYKGTNKRLSEIAQRARGGSGAGERPGAGRHRHAPHRVADTGQRRPPPLVEIVRAFHPRRLRGAGRDGPGPRDQHLRSAQPGRGPGVGPGSRAESRGVRSQPEGPRDALQRQAGPVQGGVCHLRAGDDHRPCICRRVGGAVAVPAGARDAGAGDGTTVPRGPRRCTRSSSIRRSPRRT